MVTESQRMDMAVDCRKVVFQLFRRSDSGYQEDMYGWLDVLDWMLSAAIEHRT